MILNFIKLGTRWHFFLFTHVLLSTFYNPHMSHFSCKCKWNACNVKPWLDLFQVERRNIFSEKGNASHSLNSDEEEDGYDSPHARRRGASVDEFLRGSELGRHVSPRNSNLLNFKVLQFYNCSGKLFWEFWASWQNRHALSLHLTFCLFMLYKSLQNTHSKCHNILNWIIFCLYYI